jgi:hypothetical protein
VRRTLDLLDHVHAGDDASEDGVLRVGIGLVEPAGMESATCPHPARQICAWSTKSRGAIAMAAPVQEGVVDLIKS